MNWMFDIHMGLTDLFAFCIVVAMLIALTAAGIYFMNKEDRY